MTSEWIPIPCEMPAIGTYAAAWNERRTIPFVNALHFSSAFWMVTFRMFDIWHERCVQLKNRKTLLRAAI